MPWRLRYWLPRNNKTFLVGSRSLSESWAKRINERLPQPSCFRLSTVPGSRCKVFDAIAQSAGRLCEAEFAFVFRFDGKLLSFAASYGLTPEGVAAWQNELPRPAAEDIAIGRAIPARCCADPT